MNSGDPDVDDAYRNVLFQAFLFCGFLQEFSEQEVRRDFLAGKLMLMGDGEDGGTILHTIDTIREMLLPSYHQDSPESRRDSQALAGVEFFVALLGRSSQVPVDYGGCSFPAVKSYDQWFTFFEKLSTSSYWLHKRPGTMGDNMEMPGHPALLVSSGGSFEGFGPSPGMATHSVQINAPPSRELQGREAGETPDDPKDVNLVPSAVQDASRGTEGFDYSQGYQGVKHKTGAVFRALFSEGQDVKGTHHRRPSADQITRGMQPRGPVGSKTSKLSEVGLNRPLDKWEGGSLFQGRKSYDFPSLSGAPVSQDFKSDLGVIPLMHSHPYGNPDEANKRFVAPTLVENQATSSKYERGYKKVEDYSPECDENQRVKSTVKFWSSEKGTQPKSSSHSVAHQDGMSSPSSSESEDSQYQRSPNRWYDSKSKPRKNEQEQLISALTNMRFPKEAVPPPKFDVSKGLSLKRWLREFEAYFIAKYDGTDRQKGSILGEFLLGSIQQAYQAIGGDHLKFSAIKPALLEWYHKERPSSQLRHESEFSNARMQSGETLTIFAMRLERLAEKVFRDDYERERRLCRKFWESVPSYFATVLSESERNLALTTNRRKLSWSTMKRVAEAEDRRSKIHIRKRDPSTDLEVWCSRSPEPRGNFPTGDARGHETLNEKLVRFSSDEGLNESPASQAPSHESTYPNRGGGRRYNQVFTNSARAGSHAGAMRGSGKANYVGTQSSGAVLGSQPGFQAQDRLSPRTARPASECNWCGRVGHLEYDCWRKHGRCHFCGSQDHAKEDCTTYGREARNFTPLCSCCGGEHLGQFCPNYQPPK